MKIVLHIDTSGERGLVFLSRDNLIVAARQSDEPMNHAAFLQPAFLQVLKEAGLQRHQIEGVSVSNGPGSYTGLRVGLASAKGLCFALDVPLIALSTLEIMAKAMQIAYAQQYANACYCPLIDARRNEVFAAIFNAELKAVLPQQPILLPSSILADMAPRQPVIYAGSGAAKWEAMVAPAENLHFLPLPDTQMAQLLLTQQATQNGVFASLITTEPYYQKAFFDNRKV